MTLPLSLLSASGQTPLVNPQLKGRELASLLGHGPAANFSGTKQVRED
jgi:hypothetical protein